MAHHSFSRSFTVTDAVESILNKNSLAVKKVQGQSEAALYGYKRPKYLISGKDKKILLLE